MEEITLVDKVVLNMANGRSFFEFAGSEAIRNVIVWGEWVLCRQNSRVFDFQFFFCELDLIERL